MQDERRLIASAWARKWLWLGGLCAVAALLYALRHVLVPLLLAFFLAYALSPVVDRLVSWKVPRWLAAISVVTGLVVALVGLAIVAVPILFEQFLDATANIPDKLELLRQRLDPWLWQHFHVRMPATTGEVLLRAHEELRAAGLNIVDRAGAAVLQAFNALVLWLGVLIVPVFTLYLLIDFDAVVQRTRHLVPRRFLPTVTRVANDVHSNLANYIRGQVLANCVLTTLYAGGLYLVGIPLAVPIGILTGVFAAVPYVGFFAGLAAAMTMAVLEWQGLWPLVGVAAVMGGVQILDASFITPRIVGGAVGLKPIEVLLTMMAAATLFGFFGVILAVPIGAVLKIVLHHVARAYLASSYYRRPPLPRVAASADQPVVERAVDSKVKPAS